MWLRLGFRVQGLHSLVLKDLRFRVQGSRVDGLKDVEALLCSQGLEFWVFTGLEFRV